MSNMSRQSRDQAEEAFARLPKLSTDTHALLIVGVGSGALIERILEAYGYPHARGAEPEPGHLFADAECKNDHGLPIWIIDPNCDALESVSTEFDWEPFIDVGQLRFYCGPDALDDWSKAIQSPRNCVVTHWVITPDTNFPPQRIEQIIQQFQATQQRRMEDLGRLSRKQLNLQPSTGNTVAWRKRTTVDGKRRVLVMGRRWGGSYLGQCGRSLANGFEKLGHEVLYLVEQGDFESIEPFAVQHAIHDFSPDVVVWINHLQQLLNRTGNCMQGIPFCTWLQDPPMMDYLRSPEIREEHSELDVYFSCSRMWAKELENLGYGEIPVLQAPTDPTLFTPTARGSGSRIEGRHDISYVNTIPPDTVREIFCDDPTSSPMRKHLYRHIYSELQPRIAEGRRLFTPEEFKDVFSDYCQRMNPEWWREHSEDAQSIEAITFSLEHQPGRVALRGLPIEWLVEDGHSVALFGQDWSDHPVLGPHYRGAIPYGHHLSDLLRASRIHVCIHSHWTLTMKVLDAFASGSFPLVRWVEPNRDDSPIQEWFEEDRDVVLFRTREELLDKTRYYLAHPREREAISRRGRDIVTQNLTYERAAQTMLETVRARFWS